MRAHRLRTLPLVLGLLTACLLAACPARADQVFTAVTVDGTDPYSYAEADATTTDNGPSTPTAADFTGTLGWQFSPTQNVSVTSLGYFDDMGTASGGQPMSMGYSVGLYDGSGNLLAIATVTPSASATGLFHFVNLASSVGLTAGGDYVLGGVAGTDGSAYDLQNSAPFAPDISYIQDAYDPNNNSALTFPAVSDGDPSDTSSGACAAGTGDAYFGPNFQYTEDASPAPEPLRV